MKSDFIARMLAATPGWAEQAAGAGLEAGDVGQILDQASKLSENLLMPLAARADAEGCRMQDGRVIAPSGYREAYRQMGGDGWICADLDPDFGGTGLPLALTTGVNILFEGAALPFMMAAGSSRAGAHLLAVQAPELGRVWCPKVATGEWALTICISEPDAGSDVGRARTRAARDGAGWTVSGTKCWISFGDQDFTDRIGHLALARTGTPEEGSRGLSLFLVPATRDDGSDNGVRIERIEEKLGLHGSPTCVLRFEGSQGALIGEPGRGLAQLFTMIELMRLQVAWQGAGVALEAADVARAYAADRRQGGSPKGPAVPIIEHADVQRQLTAIEAQAAVSTAMICEAAVALDAGRTDPAEAAYAAFLLPLAKTFNGEGAQEAASGAIQVLGGAGYTREWKAERLYRDARILTIYEGTTGMQGQDFLLRRLVRDGGKGLSAFAAKLRGAGQDTALLERFEALSAELSARSTEGQLAVADGYLRAGWCVVSAYLAERLAGMGGREAELGAYWLALAPARMALAEAQIRWGLSQAG